MNGDLEVMEWEAVDDPELGDPYESDGFSDFEEALFEDDLEDEGFDGYNDMEFDPFLGSWVRKARGAISKVARGPFGGILKNLARKAATVAGGAIAGPAGASIAGKIANMAIREEEYGETYDYEDADFEDEYEAMGGDPDVLAEMESLAEMAADTDNEEEADQFLGAIASLAGSVLPSLLGEEEFGGDGYDGYDYEEGLDEEFFPLIPLAASLLPKAIPFVKSGVKALGKMLHRNRRTRRQTVRALPKIAMKTNVQLAKQARRGVKLTPKRVAATVARQTVKTIATPQKLARAAAPARVTTQMPRPIRTATRSLAGYSKPRRRRVIRPRYCVY